MSVYILCHGAWGGSWSWRRVEKILRDNGHTVFTPSYTGIGERNHLAGPDISLDTHIADVRGVIEYERLEDFILVGHSYGGMVITGVADPEWEKISRLVYLDAFLPKDGQCLSDLTPPEMAAKVVEAANAQGDGWKVPRPEGSIAPSVAPEDRQWLESLASFQPIKTFTQPVRTGGNHLKIADKVYVLCTERKETPFYQFAEWTRAQPGWRTLEMPIHHHLHVSAPKETAEILMS